MPDGDSFDESPPEVIAQGIAEEIGQVDYLAVVSGR
jgi:hypothetical protein